MSKTLDHHEQPSELDELLSAPEQRDHFRIEDDSAASWAMRKLATIRTKQKENIAIADAEIERLTEWVESVNHPLERDASYFENLLADYGRRQRIESDRKSVVLPYGEIKTRAGSAKWHINAEIIMAWLKENGFTNLIKVKEEPSLTALKETFLTNDGRVLTPEGEVVPGVTVENVDMTISINPSTL
jgi:phage host-nuclease inhibitor protein Gam